MNSHKEGAINHCQGRQSKRDPEVLMVDGDSVVFGVMLLFEPHSDKPKLNPYSTYVRLCRQIINFILQMRGLRYLRSMA